MLKPENQRKETFHSLALNVEDVHVRAMVHNDAPSAAPAQSQSKLFKVEATGTSKFVAETTN